MKLKATLIIAILFVLFLARLEAQNTQLPTFNIFYNADYTITGETEGYFNVKFTLKNINSSDSINKFTLKPMSFESFYLNFSKGIKEIGINEESDTSEIKGEAKRLYFYFVAGVQAAELNLNAGPKAGTMKFNTEQVSIYRQKNNYSLSKSLVKAELQKKKKNKVKRINKGKQEEKTTITIPGPVDTISSNRVNIDENSEVRIDSIVKTDTLIAYDGYKKYDLSNFEYVSWRFFGRNPNSRRVQFPYRRRFFRLDSDSIWITKKTATSTLLKKEKDKKEEKNGIIASKTKVALIIANNELEKAVKNKNKIQKERDSIDNKIAEIKRVVESKRKNFLVDSLKRNKFFTEKSSFNYLLNYDSIFNQMSVSNDSNYDSLYLNHYRDIILNNIVLTLKEEFIRIAKDSATFWISSDSLTNSIDTIENKLIKLQDSLIISSNNNEEFWLRKIEQENKSKLHTTLEISKIQKEKYKISTRRSELNWLKENINEVDTLLADYYYLKNRINQLLDDLIIIKLSDSIYTVWLKEKQEKLKNKQLTFNTLEAKYRNDLMKLNRIFFEAKNAEIEFNNGFIENISVKGKGTWISKNLEGEFMNKDIQSFELLFENLYPIGFSREADYDHLSKTYLFAQDANANIYTLRLSDVIQYDPKHEVNRRDYSPKNEVVELSEDNNEEALNKLETYKLFELKVFSDFVGFTETAPNGLIQTELENEIPINTRRWATIKVWRANYGYLGYVVPNLVISKIENKNKHLPVSYRNDFTNDVYTPEKYASTLDLYKYESFSTGLDFNLIIFDIINAKSTITFDAGFRFGTTPMVDSVRIFDGSEVVMTNESNQYNITTYRVYPKLTLAIHPEERYSIKLAYLWNFYWARTNLITQVGNAEQYALDGVSQDKINRFNTIELSAGININKTSSGKLFFRYRYNWQQNYWNTGFNQAQVGYSFYLMGRYKK